MRTIVHLSDLHFGTVDTTLVGPLCDAIEQARPDVVALSGDLTQRALVVEFEQARALIERLPGKVIVVPGNHDLSLFNPVRRVVQRLALFKQHITSDLEPFHADEEIAVLGLNTARVPLFRGGSLSRAQLAKIESHMQGLPAGTTRILVTHHPFDLPHTYARRELVRGARASAGRLLGVVDILLAGHHHVSHTGSTAVRYKAAGNSAVFVQAGTALSSRVRGESNSFNVLRVGRGSLVVEVWRREVEELRYQRAASAEFRRAPGGWARHEAG